MSEILPHEHLDREEARRGRQPPRLRQTLLLLTREIVRCPAGGEMEIDADAGEVVERVIERRDVAGGKHAGRDERRVVGGAVGDIPEPVDEVEIAKPPRRSLHVRLEQSRRLSVPGGLFPPCLTELGCHPLRRPTGERGQIAGELVERLPGAGGPIEEAGFDERAEHRGVGPGQAGRLRHRSHALPHLQPDVKEILEKATRRGRDDRVGRGGMEEHQIDVGERGLAPPPVAAVGHEDEPVDLAPLRIGPGTEIVEH